MLLENKHEITTLSSIARDYMASHSGHDEDCETYVCGTLPSTNPLKN